MTIAERLPVRILVAAAIVAWSATVLAQDAVLPPPTAPETNPVEAPSDPIPPEEPALPAPPPLVPPEESSGFRNASNTQERTLSEDGNTVRREHTVTNPNGQMVQTFERSQIDDGYQFQHVQTWTAPDGTLRRQHEMTFSGTDPYNYQREKTITLHDGRTMTMEQTRTWDGTSGTMERTFNGPNGQTQTFQRSWAPDGVHPQPPPPPEQEMPLATDPGQTPPSEPAGQLGAAQPDVATQQSPQPTQESFWRRLNPFRSSGGSASPSTSSAGRWSGFTIGTRGSGAWIGHRNGLAKNQADRVEPPGRAALRGLAARANRSQAAAPTPGASPTLGGPPTRGNGNHR